MTFSVIPSFPSGDLDRTAAFWGALGFVETARYDDSDFLILEHAMGLVLHFGLDKDLRPNENAANAYLRFSSGDEAVALHDEWASALPFDGVMRAPTTTSYGMVEWPLLDSDRNLLRVGGPAT